MTDQEAEKFLRILKSQAFYEFYGVDLDEWIKNPDPEGKSFILCQIKSLFG